MSFFLRWQPAAYTPPFLTLVTTQTLQEESGVASRAPVRIGMAFRKGDIPANNVPVLVNSADVTLTSQLDEISYFPDGSYRHAVASFFPTTVAASSTFETKIGKVVATYAASAARTLADVSANNYTIELTDVRDYINTTVGSGAFTFTVNNYISNSARTRKYATGLVRDGWCIDGSFQDVFGGTSATHIWGKVWADEWTNPDDGTPYASEINAAICLPWINVVGATSYSYKAVLKRNGVAIRDFATTKTFTDANVNTTNNRITITNHGYTSVQAVNPSGASLASPLAAGTIYYVYVIDANTITLHTNPQDAPGGSNPVDLTTTGSGTQTLTNYFSQPYRTWNFLNGPNAKSDWSSGAPTLRPAWTTAEKTYWVESGAIPAMDVSLTPTAATSVTYIPNGVGNIRAQLNATGETQGIGMVPTWVSKAFMLQDAVGLQSLRVNALSAAGINSMGTLNEEVSGGEIIARIPAMNNGSDGAGTGYSGMGTVLPNTNYWSSGNRANAVQPNGGTGCFSESTGPDGSHWPAVATHAFLVDGSRHLLEILWASANRHIFSMNPSNTYRRKTVGATTYYGLQTENSQFRSDAWRMKEVAAAAFFGGTCSEKTYFSNIIRDNYAYFAASWPTRDASWNAMRHLNVTPLDTTSPWQHGMCATVYNWIYGLDKTDTNLSMVAEHAIWQVIRYFDGTYNGSPFYASTYRSLFRPSSSATVWVSTWDQYAIHLSPIAISTDGLITISPSVLYPSYMPLSDGLKMRFSDISQGEAAVTVPPEVDTSTFYTIIAANSAAHDFKIVTSAGTTITFATPFASCAIGIVNVSGYPTGDIYGYAAQDAGNWTLNRMALLQARAVGVPDTTAAIAQANLRLSATFLADPKYAFTTSLLVT